MDTKICRNGNLELPLIGLGCWSFGGGDYWGDRNQKDTDRIVASAIDHGVNYFDTAEAYNEGRSEVSLGEAIKPFQRDQIIVGSKVSPTNCSPKALLEHCTDSLKRLGTDYIDLYMVHWPVDPRLTADAFSTLQKLKEQGKIRHFGVCNYGVPKLEELLCLPEIAINQLPYSLLTRAIEFDALDFCDSQGIGVMAYMGLMQGILADRFQQIEDIPPMRRRTRHFDSNRVKESRHGEDGCEPQLAEAMNDLREICKNKNMSMSHLSLGWILANPQITCTLVGASSIKQLEENLMPINRPISSETVELLNRITLPVKEELGNHIDLFESVENDRTR